MNNQRIVIISVFLHLAFSLAKAQVLSTPRKVETREDMRPHVGVLFGMVDPSDNYGSNVHYGIDIGYQPVIPFSAILEVSRVQTGSSKIEEKDLDRVNLLAKGNYNFGGTIPVIRYSHIGLALGPVFDSFEGVTYVKFGTGINLGVDFPFTDDVQQKHWSLGANIGYLVVSESDTDMLAAHGVVKYWY